MPTEITSLIQLFPESLQTSVMVILALVGYHNRKEAFRWATCKVLGRQSNKNENAQNTRLAVEEFKDELVPLLKEIRDELRNGNKDMQQEMRVIRGIIREHNDGIHEHVLAITEAIHQTQLMIVKQEGVR